MAQKTFVDGDVLTASDINTYLMGEGGAWTSYTPTLSQGASTDIAKTVAYSKYARHGRMITWNFWLQITGAGTSGAAVTVTLPATAASTNAVVGSGRYVDTNATGSYMAQMLGASTTTAVFYPHSTTSLSEAGVGPVFAVANGDLLTGCITYEAAS